MCDLCIKHAAPRSKATGSRQRDRPLFPLGRLAATRGVLDHLVANGVDPLPYVLRHQCGDWGDVPAEDSGANDRAVINGGRVISAYDIAGRRCWIITEANRAVTTILFPSE